MTYLDTYKSWISSPNIDEKTKDELRSIENNDDEIKSRFNILLEFGTAGMRGILGAGLNRMNIYTVRQTTKGLADYIIKCGKEACERGVAIARDSRIMSYEFSLDAALVLAQCGIKTYVFDDIRPTPELSFALRYLNCIAGINITASHNPREYNGYKVYWEDGAQIMPEIATGVCENMQKIDILQGIPVMDLCKAENSGLLKYIGAEIDGAYLRNVLAQSQADDKTRAELTQIKVVYTPFHGAGYKIVPFTLRFLGVDNLYCVKEQMQPNGLFPTVKSPNPENKEGFNIAMELALNVGADIVVGTDPDVDRVGILVKCNDGSFRSLNGNEIGVLFLDYIIKRRKESGNLPKDAFAIKSIVTSPLVQKICDKNGVKLYNVYTGFKHIGEKIKEVEIAGNGTFIFGFEESYGYLSGTYARDKDAVLGAMLGVEVAAYYRTKGMSLVDALDALFDEYGVHIEKTVNYNIGGYDSMNTMKEIMTKVRESKIQEIAGDRVESTVDYLTGDILNLKTAEKATTGMYALNVLCYNLENGTEILVRPSGTEPKIKVYIMTNADTLNNGQEKIERYKAVFDDIMK